MSVMCNQSLPCLAGCRFVATLRGVEAAERAAMELRDGEELHREGGAAGGLSFRQRALGSRGGRQMNPPPPYLAAGSRCWHAVSMNPVIQSLVGG